MILLIVAALLITVAEGNDEYYENLWKNFTIKFNKTYHSTTEETRRYEIFRNNVIRIDAHNELYNAGMVTYTQGINQFADLTPEDFFRCINTRIDDDAEIAKLKFSRIFNRTRLYPGVMDLRNGGFVTKVKDQGKCKSSWAFAVAGALEGQLKSKTGRLLELSAQNLVDCTEKYQHSECERGSSVRAFKYAVTNGIEDEKEYPYGKDRQSCKYNEKKVVAKAKNYVIVKVRKNEGHLQVALYAYGPFAISMYAPETLQFYSSGAFYDPNCKSDRFNHAALLVGYGSENRSDYWIIKNSWGTNWGEEGYLKLARNKNNHCGVANLPIYPVL